MQFPWDKDVAESSFKRKSMSWSRVSPLPPEEHQHNPSTLEVDPPSYNSRLSRREIRERRERLEEERKKQSKKTKKRASQRPPAHAFGKKTKKKVAVPIESAQREDDYSATVDFFKPEEDISLVEESNEKVDEVTQIQEQKTEAGIGVSVQEEPTEEDASATVAPSSSTTSFKDKVARRDVAIPLLTASALGVGALGVLDDFTSPPTIYAETEELVRETSGEVVSKVQDADYCPSNLYGNPVNADERSWAQSSGITGQDGKALVCLDSPYSLTVEQSDGERVRIPVEYAVYEAHSEGDTYSFDEDLHSRGVVNIRSTLPPEEHPELRYALLASSALLGVAAVRLGTSRKNSKGA